MCSCALSYISLPSLAHQTIVTAPPCIHDKPLATVYTDVSVRLHNYLNTLMQSLYHQHFWLHPFAIYSKSNVVFLFIPLLTLYWFILSSVCSGCTVNTLQDA